MARRPPVPGPAVGLVVALAVVAGCSGDGGATAGASSTSTAAVTTTTTAPSATPPAPTTSRRTAYTPTAPPVPPRDIPLPAGAPYGGNLCTLSGDTAVGVWYLRLVNQLERGESIRPEDWEGAVAALPDYQQDLVEQAVAFDEEAVPPAHPVRADLAELQAALAEAVAVAQARDSSRVLAVYDRMQYAEALFGQSCTPIEG